MMKIWLVRWTGVAVLCLSFASAFAQPYRTLTGDDFLGKPNPGYGEVVAYTNCSIDFRYEAHREKTYFLLDFTIKLTMNNCVSWMDKTRITSPEMMAEVLRHEQGHYDIAYMEQQELLRTVSKTVFYADYQKTAANIFNRIDAKYRQLNLAYDDDTNHMRNRVQQQSWNAYFKQKVNFMPPLND